jgi:hypothetical protein
LSHEITDEQVKIEKYRSDLQVDLRELARVAPSDKRWTSLAGLISYYTLSGLPLRQGWRRKRALLSQQPRRRQASARCLLEEGAMAILVTVLGKTLGR